MLREKCVILTNFDLEFFNANPYSRNFVFVKNLSDDNIGLSNLWRQFGWLWIIGKLLNN